jgi:hypothetical protein
MEQEKKLGYKASLKSLDTEEHIDLAFYRPIGYAWACLAAKLGITPNAITIASIFLGVGAGIAFYFNDIWINIIGMLLLIWANSFDSADGQLARMTKQYSRIGRILDGLSGDLWFLSIYVAICLRENYTSAFFMAHPWRIWVIAVTAGYCHARQAAMADYYRQFHLFFLHHGERSELEKSSDLQSKYDSMSWKKQPVQKFIMTFYLRYTINQEHLTPAMQKLRAALAERYPEGNVPVSFRDEFRRLSLPLMKYTNILSFNWRSIALFVSLFAQMPWLYFAFEIVVLNGLLVYMVTRHESICRQLTVRVRNGEFR